MNDFICQAQTQYKDNEMAGTERQRMLILHPSQKTNQHTNTKLITRSGTHTWIKTAVMN